MRDYHLGKLLVVGAIVIGGIYHFSSRALFYKAVEGTIVETKVMCFIKDGNHAVYTNGYSDLAFMDCDTAPAVAKEKGYRPEAVQKGTVYKVSWASPVDNSVHTAEKYATGVGGYIVVGNKKKIYASKYDPNGMQWN
jgi:hypothetical protein